MVGRRREKDGKIRTLQKISGLKKRVLEARLTGAKLSVNDSLEYEILRQALELLSDTINVQSLARSEEGV